MGENSGFGKIKKEKNHGIYYWSIEDIMLAHELFHYIESRKAKTIYTRVEKIQLWRKPFSNRSGIHALSEIAAMAFAREYFQLDFLPFALAPLMLWLYDREGGKKLYDEILKFNVQLSCNTAGIHSQCRLARAGVS